MTVRPAVPSGRTRSGGDARATFALDVQYYLSQDPRQLPSRYLYDALGSCLFEAICRLPWYPITRAETRLLAAHRRAVNFRHHQFSHRRGRLRGDKGRRFEFATTSAEANILSIRQRPAYQRHRNNHQEDAQADQT